MRINRGAEFQVFARKLVSLRVDLKREDVENEFRATAKLCTPPTHKNIVEVYNHGPLHVAEYYFLDMALCDLNLEDYLKRNVTKEAQKMGYLDDLPQRTRAEQIWAIMEDITCGVAFIHSNDEIHRDLKPRNSTPRLKCSNHI